MLPAPGWVTATAGAVVSVGTEVESSIADVRRVVDALRPHAALPFHSHLMISQPLRFVDEFANAGSYGIEGDLRLPFFLKIRVERLHDQELPPVEGFVLDGGDDRADDDAGGGGEPAQRAEHQLSPNFAAMSATAAKGTASTTRSPVTLGSSVVVVM